MEGLKTLLVLGSIAFIPSQSFAQTPDSVNVSGLATPPGHEVNVAVSGYEWGMVA
jgi:hypothetical protein